MRSILALSLASATLGLLACSSGSSDAAQLEVSNLGLAAYGVFGSGELCLVAVSEEGQELDLDGDGDLVDLVVHVLDLGAPSLTNTGLAMPPLFRTDQVPPPLPRCSETLAVFVVSEPLTGRDVNGDGDLDDDFTRVFERRTGEVEDLPFRYALAFPAEDLAAFQVLEGQRWVLRVFDARDGSSTLVPGEGLAVAFVQDELVGFLENENGLVDLNADGDALDPTVLRIWDADARLVLPLGWAVIPSEVRLAGGWIGMMVPEAGQGGLDLDGDGRTDGTGFVALDPRSGITRLPRLGPTQYAEVSARDSERFLLRVDELEDRNGDGDSDDRVIVVYDPRADRAQDTGLAGLLAVSAGRWIGVPVREWMQGGADLDGDGLPFSDVLHVFDTHSGAVQNLRLETELPTGLDGHLLARRNENDGDWNADGDRNDWVLFDWDGRTRTLRSTGYAVAGLHGSTSEDALMLVHEQEQQADLNQDGDLFDHVFGLYQGRAGALRILGVSGYYSSGLAASGRTALVVSEQDQGLDLNGDGDLLDNVVHAVLPGL